MEGAIRLGASGEDFWSGGNELNLGSSNGSLQEKPGQDSIYSWVEEQMEGHLILDAVQEEDGCAAVVLMRENDLSLSVLAVNAKDEAHQFKILFEDAGPISAELSIYKFQEVIREEERQIEVHRPGETLGQSGEIETSSAIEDSAETSELTDIEDSAETSEHTEGSASQEALPSSSYTEELLKDKTLDTEEGRSAQEETPASSSEGGDDTAGPTDIGVVTGNNGLVVPLAFTSGTKNTYRKTAFIPSVSMSFPSFLSLNADSGDDEVFDEERHGETTTVQVVVDMTVVDDYHDSVSNAEKGVVVDVQNGAGIIFFDTPSLFSALLPVSFTTTISTGDTLKIYGDGAAVNNYCTWSGDTLPLEYDLYADSVITMVRGGITAVYNSMRIEFYNTAPVEIAQFNASNLSGGTITIIGTGADSVFDLDVSRAGTVAVDSAFNAGSSAVVSGAVSGSVKIQAKTDKTGAGGFITTGTLTLAGSAYDITGTATGTNGTGVSASNVIISNYAKLTGNGKLHGVFTSVGAISVTNRAELTGVSTPDSITSGVKYAGVYASLDITLNTMGKLYGTCDVISKTPPAGAGTYTPDQILAQLQTFGIYGRRIWVRDGEASFDGTDKTTMIGTGGDCGTYVNNADLTRVYIYNGPYCEFTGNWVGLYIGGGSYVWMGDAYTKVVANAAGYAADGSPVGYGILSVPQFHMRKENETPLSSVYSGNGGLVLTTGSKVGIRGSYVAVYDCSTLVAMGGVDSSYQLGSDYSVPKDEKGDSILPAYVPDTYGVYVPTIGTYFVAYHGGNAFCYGGDYGILSEGSNAATGYVTSYHSSEVFAYGGNVGASSSKSWLDVGSSAHFECEGRKTGAMAGVDVYVRYTSDIYAPTDYPAKNSYNVLKARGGEVGIRLTGSSTVRANNGSSYIYAEGKEQAIQGNVSIIGTSAVVTRTTLSAIPNDTGQSPEAVASNPSVSGSVTGSSTGLFHEIFDVEDFDIKSPPPVALNQKYNALKVSMGAGNRQINNYGWTTPVSGPEDTDVWPTSTLSDLGYLSYNSTDDQQLLKKSGHLYSDGIMRVGVEALQSVKDVCIVANGTAQAAAAITGFPAGTSAIGSVSSGSKHRITIMGLNIVDNRTMDVEIKLTEDLFDQQANNMLLLDEIPLATSYRLDYWPLPENDADGTPIPNDYTTPVRSVIIDNSGGLVPADKLIHLSKLQMGEYILTPINQAGYPYRDYATDSGDGIKFTIKVDTADLTGAPLNPNWYEKVFLDTASPTAQRTRMTLAAGAAGTGISKSATEPTFYQPDPALKAMVPERYGEFRLVYQRIKHTVDFRLIDADFTNLHLDGEFTLKAYKNATDLTPVYSLDNSTRTGGSPASWEPLELWTGLVYEIKQTNRQLPYYIMRTETFKFQLSDASGNLAVITAAEGYTGATIAPKDQFSIVVTNDLPTITASPMYLLNASDLTQKISGGRFTLQAKLANGEVGPVDRLADDGMAGYALTLKPERTYYLEQTQQPKSYAKRDKVYEFEIGVELTGTVYTLKQINYLNAAAADGWETGFTGYDSKTIYISNLVGTGNLRIDVTGQRIWKPHGDPGFLVKLVGTGGNAAGSVYYDYVRLTNGVTQVTQLNTSASTDTGSVVFQGVTIGTYDVTVYPSVRFSPVSPASVTGITVSGGDTGADASAGFTFDCTNHKYLSDVQGIEYEFTIDFSGL